MGSQMDDPVAGGASIIFIPTLTRVVALKSGRAARECARTGSPEELTRSTGVRARSTVCTGAASQSFEPVRLGRRATNAIVRGESSIRGGSLERRRRMHTFVHIVFGRANCF